MKSLRLIIPASVISFLCSCASIVPPTGGPVDSKPPEVVEQSPANGSTLVKNNSIEVEFDEYLNASADPSSIIISPQPEKKPDIEINKKKVTIKFKEKLRENTTYTINFGEFIKDNNEGNTLVDYTIVFSTGPEIDKGSVQGRVVFSDNMEPGKNMLIALHKNLSDSAVLKLKPDYTVKTKEDGSFQFKNLPSGQFRIYAIDDLNKNQLCDPGENIAFADKSLQVSADSQQVDLLRMFTYNPGEEIKLTRFHRNNEYTYVFGFNQNVNDSSVSIIPSLQTNGYLLEKSVVKSDSIYFYYYPPVKTDSIVFNVLVKNRPIARELIYPKNSEQNSFTIKRYNSFSDMLDLGDTLSFITEKPIKNIDINRIRIKAEDSSFLKVKNTLADPDHPSRFFLFADFKPGNRYIIEIPDSSITAIKEVYNKSYKLSLNIAEEKRYGSITYEVNNESGKTLIIQLLDEKNRVIRTRITRQNTSINEPWIKPGKYRIKIIWDKNGNLMWDSGDYQEYKQPEEVYIHPVDIVVRSNWDVSDMRINPLFR